MLAAGTLFTGKMVHIKHAETMEFITCEDQTGLIETTFFPRAYRRFCNILDRTRPFVLIGKVEEDFGALSLTVSHVEDIAQQKKEVLSFSKRVD